LNWFGVDLRKTRDASRFENAKRELVRRPHGQKIRDRKLIANGFHFTPDLIVPSLQRPGLKGPGYD
jgi:hypothetical protein